MRITVVVLQMPESAAPGMEKNHEGKNVVEIAGTKATGLAPGLPNSTDRSRDPTERGRCRFCQDRNVYHCCSSSDA